MNGIKTGIALVGVGLLAQSLFADRYVSSDKDYGSGPGGAVVAGDALYDDLQTAINEASAGETVWIKDGFVCDSGLAGVGSSDSTSTTNRIYITKDLTVRSQSGYVDDAAGKGATIRGAYASDNWQCTTGSVRCAYVYGAAVTLRGLVFEGGSSRCNINNGGGGLRLNSDTKEMLVTNCVFRNNYGFCGAGVWSGAPKAVFADCVFTNNTAKGKYQDNWGNGWEGSGAGLYGKGSVRHCLIRDNYAQTGGGGLYYSGLEMRDTKILCNTAGGRGGGIIFDSSTGSDVRDCLIATNKVTSGPAGGVCAGYMSSSIGRLYGCEILGNTASQPGGGVWSQDNPPGRTGYAVLVGCRVEGNVGGSGGAIYAGRAFVTNCVLRNNTADGGSGGAVGVVVDKGKTDVHIVNTLMEGNSAKWGGAARCAALVSGRALFINCTAISNKSIHASSCGGFEGDGGAGATIVNTISWDNTGTKKFDEVAAATNSCFTAQTDVSDFGPGNISTDPKFVGEGDGPYVVKRSSPCWNAGYYDKGNPAWAWMTDKANPASKALNGVPRLQGSAPDMGAYERKGYGLTVEVR